MNNTFQKFYQSVILFQLITFLFFFITFMEENANIDIPISIPLPGWKFEFTFQFTYAAIVGFVIAMGTLYVLAGVQVAASGNNETGTKSIKEFVIFISKFSILLTPVVYFFSQSEILSEYVVHISLFIFLIHLFAFMERSQSQGGASE